MAVPKIDTAIKYQKYFEQQTDAALKINTKVVFTPPDSRQDNDDVWSETTSESQKYWKQISYMHIPLVVSLFTIAVGGDMAAPYPSLYF